VASEMKRKKFGLPIHAGLACFVGTLAVLLMIPGHAHAAEKAPFKALPAASVDSAGIAQARAAAVGLLSRWAAGKYEPLSDAFTEQIRKAMSPESQRKAYAAIKARYGDFKSLAYAEAATSPDHARFIVYRFKGVFSGTKKKLEVRVLMYTSGKVAGFWVRPWKNEIK
jgi:hypothetical protein